MPASSELNGLEVRQLKIGPARNFSYLVWDEETHQAAAIDSGWETQPILEAVANEGLKLLYAIATHQHSDHTASLRRLATEAGCELIAHESSPIGPDRTVKDDDVIRLGRGSLRVIHTPGHTVDGICLYDGQHLFTGDTLFIGNCGRTDISGGSDEALFRSLHSLMMLPPDTMVYPGHDYGQVPSRRLGDEIRENPTLRAKDIEEFKALP